jgi:hypothetical protein
MDLIIASINGGLSIIETGMNRHSSATEAKKEDSRGRFSGVK